jgi:protein SCO1/2
VRRSLTLITTALAFGLLAACASPNAAPAGDLVTTGPSGPFRGTNVEPPFDLPTQTFTDTSGARTTIGGPAAATDSATVLLFAYTHCPDVCNAQLAALAAALRRLPADVREQVEVVMVTTDPARDDADTIRRYLDGFGDGYVGLRADLARAQAAGQPLGVFIERGEDTSGGGYEVDHTAALFGFDAQGRGVVLWQPGVAVDDLVTDLQTLVASAEPNDAA